MRTHVILDTNAFHLDYNLTAARFRGFCGHCRLAGFQIYFPEVVILEIADQAVKAYLEVQSSIKKLESQFNRILGPPPAEAMMALKAFPPLDRAKHFEHLKIHLSGLGVRIMPCTAISHLEVVERLSDGRKPFKEGKNRETGYKDFLIWQSVLALISTVGDEDKVAFVTGNSNDFFTTRSAKESQVPKVLELHSDLVGDLSKLGFDNDRLSIYKNVEDFEDSELPSSVKVTHSVEERLLEAGLQSILGPLQRDLPHDIDSEVLGFSYGDFSVDSVHNIAQANLRAIVADESEVIVMIEADLGCEITGVTHEDSANANSEIIQWSEPGLFFVRVHVQEYVRVILSLVLTDALSNNEFAVAEVDLDFGPHEFYEVVSMVSLYPNSSLDGEAVSGVVLSTYGGVHERKPDRVFPTRRLYKTGQRVSWEWDFKETHTSLWMRDAKTGLAVRPFTESANFAGRILPSIQLTV